MYKNQLQELAQRSCFNLPSYACIREGPDHAPRFKACVNFNGEVFEGPSYCTTLRQAEHAAAEVALSNLSNKGPSRSLAARVLDETGVYKNLLQETAHRAGLKLPVYTTERSGPGHQPVFTSTVELAGMSFTGEPAKTKKQAEKNAAMTAWSCLKQMPNLDSLTQQTRETESSEEQEQVVVARVLCNFRPQEESRPMRQRDQQQQQQQQRRRVMLGYREGSTGTGSSHNSSWYHHQWKSPVPLSDASFTYPVQQQQKQKQKQSSLLALPPPTGPKILPPLPIFQYSAASSQEPSSSKDYNNNNNNHNHPVLISSSRPIPVQVRNRSHISIRENHPSLEEHQKDEKEWINERSDIRGKDTEKDPYSAKPTPTPAFSYNRVQSSPGFATRMPEPKAWQTQISTRPFSPPPRARPPIAAAPMRNSPAITIPRMMHSGGFHASGIAPAVHIRSVIPVCSAPPARPPVNTTAAAADDKKEREEEISASTSKLNKLQL